MTPKKQFPFALLLIVILALATVVRLQLFTGQIRGGDDMYYAKAAYELSQGRTHFDVWSFGTARVGLYAPTALFYALFGVSEFTTALFPLLTSLGTLVIVYSLATLFADRKAGLLATMLWAVFPLDVFLATDLLPDGPVTFFYIAAIYCWFRFEREERGRTWWLAGCIAAIIWGFYVKPTILAAVLFIFFYLLLTRGYPYLRTRRINYQRWVIGIVISLGILVFGAMLLTQWSTFPLRLASTASDLSELWILGRTEAITTYTPLFFVFGPLLLIGVFDQLIHNSKALALLGASLFGLFFYEWGTFDVNIFQYSPIQNWTEARYLLIMLPPLFALTGIFLAQRIPNTHIFLLVTGFCALVGLGAVATNIPMISAQASKVFQLASVVALVLVVIRLAAARSIKSSLTQWLTFAFVIVLGLAALAPTPPYSRTYYADRQQRLQALIHFADTVSRDAETIVFTDRREIALEYAFGYELHPTWSNEFPGVPDGQIQFVEDPSVLHLKPGSYLILFGQDHVPPPNGRLVSETRYGERVLLRTYQFAGDDVE